MPEHAPAAIDAKLSSECRGCSVESGNGVMFINFCAEKQRNKKRKSFNNLTSLTFFQIRENYYLIAAVEDG